MKQQRLLVDQSKNPVLSNRGEKEEYAAIADIEIRTETAVQNQRYRWSNSCNRTASIQGQ